MPDLAPAASSGTMNLLNIGGIDARTGVYYNYVETYAGGQGGIPGLDGMDAVQNHMTNTRNAPVESIETAYPLRVEAYELVADSEGPGRHRGGVGLRRKVRVVGDQVRLTLSSDRAEVAPWGLHGGHRASPSRCFVAGPGGEQSRLPSKVTTTVSGGNVIVTQTPGGGGFGDPTKRDPQAVLADVESGLVSIARARDIYLVAVDAGRMDVDEAETARLRGSA